MINKGKTKFRHLTLTGIIVILCSTLLTACIDDEPLNNGNPEEETTVHLTMITPGASLPKAATRSSAVDMEYLVSDVSILVFTGYGNTYRFTYMVQGEEVRPDNNSAQKTHFTAKLKASDEPVKLLLVANAADAFTKYIPAFNTPEEEIRSKLIAGFTKQYPDGIPLFGEHILPLLDTQKVNSFTTTMLRAIARVDVEVDLDTNTSNSFILESVHIYRAADQVQVIPAGAAMAQSETPKVIAPSVPDGIVKVPPYSKNVSTEGQTLIEKLYVSEATGLDPDENFRNVTCVVVGGYYNGSTTPTYYRADFNSGIGGHPFGQILRNHRYHFKIKSVNGSGWETPGEAANNRATLIDLEIQEWEDFTTDMYANGDNYFGIDSREIIFGYQDGLKKAVGVQATVPYKIYWQDTASETTVVGGAPITNQYFSAQIINTPGDAADVSSILITTLSENTTTQNHTSTLIVEWANWLFRIKVTQQYEVVNAERSIRVLSVYYSTAGHLGNSTEAANGKGMRAILSNAENFSPRGIVNFFSGFDFNLAGSQSIFRYADGTNDYTHQMLSLLNGCDVLYLGNENVASEYTTRKIMEWLEQDPRRVLIVAGDASNSSPYLLREDYNGILSNQVDWWYNVTHTDSYKVQSQGTDGFSGPTAITDDNRIFMVGPFGATQSVNTSFTVSTADGYYGYAKTYPDNITPLLFIKNSPTNMVVGVDQKRRIIYHGDASLFQSGRLSESGKIQTDHDKLWANIWAWIAHQVIWGDAGLIE